MTSPSLTNRGEAAVALNHTWPAAVGARRTHDRSQTCICSAGPVRGRPMAAIASCSQRSAPANQPRAVQGRPSWPVPLPASSSTTRAARRRPRRRRRRPARPARPRPARRAGRPGPWGRQAGSPAGAGPRAPRARPGSAAGGRRCRAGRAGRAGPGRARPSRPGRGARSRAGTGPRPAVPAAPLARWDGPPPSGYGPASRRRSWTDPRAGRAVPHPHFRSSAGPAATRRPGAAPRPGRPRCTRRRR